MHSVWDKLDVREKALLVGFYALSLVLTALLAYGWGRNAGAQSLPTISMNTVPSPTVHTIDLDTPPSKPSEGASAPSPPEPPQPEPRPLTVHVAGAVQKPGVYTLAEGSRVADALRQAGGTKPNADTDALNLAEPLLDGQRIYLPRKNETAPATAASAQPPSTRWDAPRNAPADRVQFPLDLNRATADQLEALPGIGPVLAQRIVEYRRQVGRFQSVDDLLGVHGIGSKRLEQIRPYVVVR